MCRGPASLSPPKLPYYRIEKKIAYGCYLACSPVFYLLERTQPDTEHVSRFFIFLFWLFQWVAPEVSSFPPGLFLFPAIIQ